MVGILWRNRRSTDAHVVVFHYRGYSPSSGDANAAALLEDALAVHDAALSAVKPKRVIALGISIGAGFGIEGAGDADALVLGFGGNAANADGTAMMLRALYPDAFVKKNLLFNQLVE